MGIMEKIFGGKTATTITAKAIREEIDRCEAEIARLNAEIAPKLAAVVSMTDSEHIKAEADSAATRRAIARLDARVGHLTTELPAVLAAEEATAKAESNAALRTRAEACRKANDREAKKLLDLYAEHSNAIGDILAKLSAIDTERAAVNEALRTNKVADPVASYNDIHRKHPDRPEAVVTEPRPCLVYRYPGSPADTGKAKFQYEAPREEIRPATIGADGKPVPGGTEIHNYYGREIVITPVLETRNITVGRQRFRPGRTEHPLADVRLPPAFSGGQWAWPRP